MTILYRIYCKKTNRWKGQSTYGWQEKEGSAKNWSSLKLAQNALRDWLLYPYRETMRPVVMKYELTLIGEVDYETSNSNRKNCS